MAIVELIEVINGEAFAEFFLIISLLLLFSTMIVDIVTKKITNGNNILNWIIQSILLIGLFLFTRSIVGGMFSSFV